MKSKYFPHCHFLEAKLGNRLSYTWKSLHSAKGLLLEGGRWKVGDGHTINLWGQPWLYTSPYGGLVGPPAKHWKVAEVLGSNSRSWNLPNLATIASDAEIEFISKVRLPSIQSVDKFCRTSEQFGEYTVKSGYRLSMWLKLWKCCIPPKIKICLAIP